MSNVGRSKYSRNFTSYGTCDWRVNVQPWEYGRKLTKDDALCNVETPLSVARLDDTPLNLCAEHLAAFLWLFGPHKVEHAHGHLGGLSVPKGL
jgi:hypothetical protein